MQPHDDILRPGKPPKTSGHIRAVIKRVHGANRDSASDLPPGGAPHDVATLVPAAEFKHRASAKHFAAKLESHRLPCKVVRRSGRSFVYVLLAHLDEALAIYKQCIRESRRRSRSRVVTADALAEAPKSPLTRLQPLLYVLSAVVGASVAGCLLDANFPAADARLQISVVVVGCVAGLFTWHVFSSMMSGRFVRRPQREVIDEIEEPAEPQTFSWSTLLTTWRSRRSTRSRRASAPSSATNPF